MKISIQQKILDKYPKAEIGYLFADVMIKKIDPYVEILKENLLNELHKIGINATNFVTHPNISIWRKIYEQDFLVKPKTYRSSVESLLKRILSGKGVWNISNVVDLYNCCSLYSLLPMGGYDLSKIEGNIVIRYAEENESFYPLGEKKIETNSNHIVYADEKKIMCWLWNHKDSAETCLDNETKKVIFFIDSAQPSDHQSLCNAIQHLKENIEKIQCVPIHSGVLNREYPEVTIGEK